MNRTIFLCMLACLLALSGRAQENKCVTGGDGSVMAETNPQGIKQSLSAEEFQKLLADTTVQLIDVRTPDEYKEGYIPGARNMDVRSGDFEKSIGLLDRNRPVAVYCRSGVRSKIALAKLTQKGFKVFELEKGINSWTGKKSKSQK